jgi:hypothetical protein
VIAFRPSITPLSAMSRPDAAQIVLAAGLFVALVGARRADA